MNIVAFAGGVGGAKLADGLSRCLLPEQLTIVVNTGDDFEHWGLKICPDLDTVCYTLAGIANRETGWGRNDENWQVFDNIRQLGGPDWFRIGDKDLATHLERTRRLKIGQSLSEITKFFCQSWNINPAILPMSNQPVSTIVSTDEMGELEFQEYFVHQHCQPTVRGFRFAGISEAEPTPGILEAIRKADAVIFCPSNPWVSIDPILNIPGIHKSVEKKRVIAVSPIIAGQTIKGPAGKMFLELGFESSSAAVANHYKGLISDFVLDMQDSQLADSIETMGIHTLICNTIMKSTNDRLQLARDVLNLI
jgi:LPPG:FO 2-phospho-L-lactate transferase